MATIRRRKDTKSKRYTVDYQDASRKRHTRDFKSRAAAEEFRKQVDYEPGGDPNVTFGQMAERWLTVTTTSVRPQTLSQYDANLRIHILSAFGELKISRIESDFVLYFLSGKLNDGLSPRKVGSLKSTLYSVFTFAIEARAMRHNPAMGMGKKLKLRRLTKKGDVKPFTEEELKSLLEAAAAMRPGRTANRFAGADRDYPLLFTMAQTGLRIGEAVALQWSDLDFLKRQIRVKKQLVGKHLESYCKTKRSDRIVDMSSDLHRLLLNLRAERMEKERLRYGWEDFPPWLFCGRHGKPLLARNVAARFKFILKAAGLPLHHTPHDLRHTYACRHIQSGTNPVYVQRQLGHSSIQMTCDIYGRWFPISDLAAADRLVIKN